MALKEAPMLLRLDFRLIVLVVCCFPVAATAVEADFYGSLRLHGEYVDADNRPDNFNDYAGLRDAYSRVGLKLSQQLNADWQALFQLELPIDLANMANQDPWDQDEELRVLKIQLSGPYGTLWYGQGWMPYYNQVAYPVDYFSSFYSGYATFTAFRLKDTLSYTSPEIAGFQISAATSRDNGNRGNRRDQFALSYHNQGLRLAVGIDEISGTSDQIILGTAVSYQSGNWYLAAKYEEFSSDIGGNGWAADGTNAINALVQYSLGQHAFRAMVANVDNYGESVFHAGWDYQYRDDLKFYVEYYQEEETAAIADNRQTTSGGSNSDPADSGGRVLVAGIRYDF